jgi:two-component system, cell cycle response regulator DivK
MTPPQIRRDILRDWNVMVVDDEVDSLEVASRILRHYGAKVASAGNGREALEMVRKVHPRFIVSDLSMPVMDGWGLLYELKLERDTMEIPVIALTAHAMVGDRQRAIEAGFHNYLTKPLTASTFMSELLRLLLDIPLLAAELSSGEVA